MVSHSKDSCPIQPDIMMSSNGRQHSIIHNIFVLLRAFLFRSLCAFWSSDVCGSKKSAFVRMRLKSGAVRSAYYKWFPAKFPFRFNLECDLVVSIFSKAVFNHVCYLVAGYVFAFIPFFLVFITIARARNLHVKYIVINFITWISVQKVRHCDTERNRMESNGIEWNRSEFLRLWWKYTCPFVQLYRTYFEIKLLHRIIALLYERATGICANAEYKQPWFSISSLTWPCKKYGSLDLINIRFHPQARKWSNY